MSSARVSSEWSNSTLGEIAVFVNGFGFSQDQWQDVGYPIIRIENMRDPAAATNYYAGTLPERYKVGNGDILLSWSATLMALIWNRGPAWVNQHIFKVTPKHGIDQHFLYHLLSNALIDLSAQAHGTTMKHIKRSDLLPFQVCIPSSIEQRRIAEILDTTNEAIRSTERLIAKLEQARQGLLHDLLTRGIDDSGQLRNPEHDPERFLNSTLGPLPQGWTLRSCAEITEPSAPIRYGIVQAGRYVTNGIPVVMIRNLLRGSFGNFHKTDPIIDQLYSRSRVRPGDLLLSIKGTIGRAMVVPLGYEGNISRDLARIRLTTECLPEYLQIFFESTLGRRLLDLAVVGTTRAEVSIGILRALQLPIPPIREQRSIVALVQAYDQRFEAERDSLAKLQVLKQGLMDDLLTRRVRVGTLG